MRENSWQGGSGAAQFLKDGEQFLVVIVHPESIAEAPFTGRDIAKEQGLC